jgi:anti-sigma regulatory factor (Ser/Thr protein kinase)
VSAGLAAVDDSHRLTLRNSRAEIARLMPWVEGLVARLGVPPRTAHALQLCLEEAVTNIVSHAFEPGTGHDVQIAVWRDDAALHAEVTDDGSPFDPLSHVLPAAPRDLQSAPIGGLGIKLMRSFAERIAYRRCGETNRLTLSFSVPRPEPKEVGGPQGPEPTRYGDWEINGRCVDF